MVNFPSKGLPAVGMADRRFNFDFNFDFNSIYLISNDQKTQNRRIPALFTLEESQDGQAQKSWHVQNPGRSGAA
jgi:hypothetical protein